ncbi:MAG TPA: hypothetical protein DCY07_03090 [Rhodospirillaceae bacterium]|nr:hypothetical protein [Rhodospirillaceae bacterium]
MRTRANGAEKNADKLSNQIISIANTIPALSLRKPKAQRDDGASERQRKCTVRALLTLQQRDGGNMVKAIFPTPHYCWEKD